jgi:uroporphyrinogen III methyltransferase/synthase
VVPGVTSATAVPASAGIPVTHRGLSSSVTVVTGRVGEAGTGVDWASLAKAGGTLVVLMGVATRAEIARRLMEAGRPAETPAAVVEWGTTPAQRTVRTTLGALGAAEVVAPAVVVVGEVAGLDLGSLAARPLAGTTVVVTRARGQAGPLTAALADAGARVLELAVVALADPEDGGAALKKAARGAGGYDWVAFTSANAVHRLVPLLRDSRGFGPARLAAVGEATAQALAAYHLVADLVPVDGAGGAAALAAAFPDPPPGGRVLFPRAADARRALPEGLLARGWAVDEVVAYRTVAAPPPPAALCHELAGAQVVTFTSPSTVEGYLAQRDPAGRPLPVPPVVACIGPTTAEAARRAGLAVAVEPGSPSAAALAAALAARLGTAPPTAP